jgi:hypothetical protein
MGMNDKPNTDTGEMAACECGHNKTDHQAGVGCFANSWKAGQSCACGRFRPAAAPALGVEDARNDLIRIAGNLLTRAPIIGRDELKTQSEGKSDSIMEREFEARRSIKQRYESFCKQFPSRAYGYPALTVLFAQSERAAQARELEAAREVIKGYANTNRWANCYLGQGNERRLTTYKVKFHDHADGWEKAQEFLAQFPDPNETPKDGPPFTNELPCERCGAKVVVPLGAKTFNHLVCPKRRSERNPGGNEMKIELPVRYEDTIGEIFDATDKVICATYYGNTSSTEADELGERIAYILNDHTRLSAEVEDAMSEIRMIRQEIQAGIKLEGGDIDISGRMVLELLARIEKAMSPYDPNGGEEGEKNLGSS